MNKQALTKAFKNVPKFLKKHSPEILTGIGIAGMVITTISAVRVTPKALRMIDEREIKDGKRLTTGEVVKTTWKCYLPSAITGVASIGCIIGASSLNARKNAGLAAAYAISVQELSDYQKKTLEVVGEKKEQAIRDEIAQDKLESAHVKDRPHVITGHGETCCFEPLTNTPFKSDIETIRRAENNLNKQMRDEIKITVNDFLEELGLEPCDGAIGEEMGWDIDKGYIEINYTSRLLDGVPYMVLEHRNPPRYIGWN